MLSLIYGKNQTAVRNFILKSAKELNAPSIKEYNSESDSLGLVESTLQPDIFGQTILNVLDITKLGRTELEKLFELLKRYPKGNLILVSSRDLEPDSSIIKVVRAFKGKVVCATLARPKEVFKFLNDLFYKREKECYKSLQKLLEVDNDPIYILAMLQYQLRNIAFAKFNLTKKLSKFQVEDAVAQSQKYTYEQILSLYELLYRYDVALKTGKIFPEAVVLLAMQKILYK